MSRLFVKQQAVSFVMKMQKGKESKVLPHGIVFLQQRCDLHTDNLHIT